MGDKRAGRVARLTVSIPRSLMDELTRAKERMGLTSMNEVIRVALWDFVLKNAEKRGRD